MVPRAGLEPAQAIKTRRILSPLRLPNSATPAQISLFGGGTRIRTGA